MGWEVHPVDSGRWPDLKRLFGPNGAWSGCWCMYMRQTSAEFAARAGEKNRRALKRLVDRDRVPGLIGYEDGEPVGWVSVAPRSEFKRLDRSPVTKPVDDTPVWSIVCFYIKAGHRRRGVGRRLLEAAVEHVARNGGGVVEAYPVDPGDAKLSNPDAWPGVAAMFEEAGFAEVARRKSRRPIMRREVSA